MIPATPRPFSYIFPQTSNVFKPIDISVRINNNFHGHIILSGLNEFRFGAGTAVPKRAGGVVNKFYGLRVICVMYSGSLLFCSLIYFAFYNTIHEKDIYLTARVASISSNKFRVRSELVKTLMKKMAFFVLNLIYFNDPIGFVTNMARYFGNNRLRLFEI